MRRTLRTGGLVACLLLALAAPQSDARAETRNDARLWLAAIGQGSLEPVHSKLEKWRWWLEGQVRFRDDMGTFTQGLPRVGVGYTIFPDTTLWLGYAYVRTEPAIGRDSDENRIFQQLTWSHKSEPVTLSARTRLEQRFFNTGDDTGWRFRQLFALSVPIRNRLGLVVNDEVFVHLNDTDWGARTGFDQNRFFIGPEWAVDRHRNVRVRLGYVNQFDEIPIGPNQLNHILSLNLLMNY
jgi:hypothetical protein